MLGCFNPWSNMDKPNGWVRPYLTQSWVKTTAFFREYDKESK